ADAVRSRRPLPPQHVIHLGEQADMAIQNIGVIGAGIMGNGIAQVCAVAGLPVVMVDINDAALDKGKATIASSLDKLVKKEKLTPADREAVLARIKTTTDYGA